MFTHIHLLLTDASDDKHNLPREYQYGILFFVMFLTFLNLYFFYQLIYIIKSNKALDESIEYNLYAREKHVETMRKLTKTEQYNNYKK